VRQYLKLMAQLAATVLAALGAALAGDQHIDVSEWVNVVILALGSVAVLGAGNLPEGVWRFTKTIVSAATAGAVVLQSALSDGVSQAEWVQIALAVLGAAGVLGLRGPVVYDAATVGRHAAKLGLGPA
jgi:hypothetical protein